MSSLRSRRGDLDGDHVQPVIEVGRNRPSSIAFFRSRFVAREDRELIAITSVPPTRRNSFCSRSGGGPSAASG